MSVNQYAVTIPPSGVAVLEPASFLFVLSTGGVPVTFTLFGNGQEVFQSITAGLRIQRLKSWHGMTIVGTPGTVVSIYYGFERCIQDATDLNLTIATVTGSVSITGTVNVDVTNTPAVTISGTPAVTVSGTPAVTVSGTPTVDVTNTVNVDVVNTPNVAVTSNVQPPVNTTINATSLYGVATGTSSQVGGNVNRRTITLSNGINNSGTVYIQSHGLNTANCGIVLQPGTFVEIDNTSTFDIRNDSGVTVYVSIWEEQA